MLVDQGTPRQLARYVLVGLAGYAIQVSTFALMVHGGGVQYMAAALVAGALALASNFALNRHWTFEVSDGSVGSQAARYLVISAIFFGVQLAILHILVTIGVAHVIAEALSVAAVVPVNFLSQRRFAFTAP